MGKRNFVNVNGVTIETLISGGYRLSDETLMPYTTRGTEGEKYKWETGWDEDLNLKYLLLDIFMLTDVVLNKEKDHDDYHRSVRTMNRHLNALKDHLGIERKKPKKKEPQKMFYLNKSFGKHDIIRNDEVTIYDKQLQLKSHSYKETKNAYKLTPVTDEKQKLVDEYNQKLREFNQYKEEMLKKIFEEEN